MSKRRGHGEGSIYQRKDGRWEGKVRPPPEADNVGRRSVYGRTRREVVEKMRDLHTELVSGAVPDKRITVEQHFLAWLETIKATVRTGTYVRYEQLAPIVRGSG